MKRQLVIFSIIIVVCGLFLYGLIWLIQSQKSTTLPPGPGDGLPITPLGDVPRTPAPTGDTFTLQTLQGPVAVKNFFKTSQPLLGYDGVMLKETANYQILYYTKEQNLLVSIMNQPL